MLPFKPFDVGIHKSHIGSIHQKCDINDITFASNGHYGMGMFFKRIVLKWAVQMNQPLA